MQSIFVIPGTGKNDAITIQQYQDSLCSLYLENLKGLVIDLRLNEGGSIYPMFTGFNQLFGSKTIGYIYGIKKIRLAGYLFKTAATITANTE